RVVARRKGGGQTGALRLDADIASLTINVDIVGWDIVVQTLFDFVGSHAQPGSETVVTLRGDLEKHLLRLSIGNRTLRIADIERNQLFMRYGASADNDSSTAGLFIIRQYVEMSKGTIALAPGAAGGQCFSLVLPFDNRRQPSVAEGLPVVDKLFAQATAVIEAHIADTNFNVTGLQAALGVGDKYLYRKIKQQSGMSPVEYIRNIRMRKASLLLREGKYSISEVMFMVGFSNPGYFSKCFQRAYGMTPTEFLKCEV
ncbi:helix-turn-helix domain-containing protein, partial [Segatella baroniae]